MTNDELNEKLKEIKSWCESNNISIFQGIIEREDFHVIEWSVKKDTDWKKFLQIAQKNNINTIIIFEMFYEPEDFESDTEMYNKLIETNPELMDTIKLDDETLKEINLSLKELENRTNQMLYYGLYWIKESICYEYYESAEWYGSWSYLHNFSEIVDNEDRYIKKTENSETETEILNLARKVAADERFQNAKNRNQRENVASLIAGDEINKDPKAIFQIVRKATYILDGEVKPKKEKELKEQVKKLKSEGYNRLAISSKLGIPWAKVDKYYNREVEQED
jgi:hypothetical protein